MPTSLAAFLAKPDWGAVLRATFIPHVEWSAAYWATLVGIFGTTISPYLFFWQASQEVEEERKKGLVTVEAAAAELRDAELRKSRNDVITGMFFSNLIMYFIILTTAATLHAHGKTTITTAQDAAEALRPLAGTGAYWLFSLGLIGAGMLGVPVLAGSSAYAVAEAAAWRGSLADRRRSRARILWSHRGRFGAGTGAELRRLQRGIHAVLVGGAERRAGAAADRHRAAADQQPGGHGNARESPLAGGAGMDHGGGDDGGDVAMFATMFTTWKTNGERAGPPYTQNIENSSSTRRGSMSYFAEILTGAKIDSVLVDSEVTYIMLTNGTQITIRGLVVVQPKNGNVIRCQRFGLT